MAGSIGEAHAIQRLLGAPLPLGYRSAGVNSGQLHVFQRGRARQEIELLKYETDFVTANFRQLVFGKAGNIFSVEMVLAARRFVETANDVH